jgi:hypothetical protein
MKILQKKMPKIKFSLIPLFTALCNKKALPDQEGLFYFKQFF